MDRYRKERRKEGKERLKEGKLEGCCIGYFMSKLGESEPTHNLPPTSEPPLKVSLCF